MFCKNDKNHYPSLCDTPDDLFSAQVKATDLAVQETFCSYKQIFCKKVANLASLVDKKNLNTEALQNSFGEALGYFK